MHNANQVWKQKFQEMEEKRIEFLHHSLCVYVNILQTVTDQEREVNHDMSRPWCLFFIMTDPVFYIFQSHEQIWDLLDHCDVEQDIQHFIEAQGTGNNIPGLYPF